MKNMVGQYCIQLRNKLTAAGRMKSNPHPFPNCSDPNVEFLFVKVFSLTVGCHYITSLWSWLYSFNESLFCPESHFILPDGG